MRDPRDPASRDRRAGTDGRLARPRGARARGRRPRRRLRSRRRARARRRSTRGCVDEAADDLAAAVAGAELVVLCAPVTELPAVLAELAELAPEATITDIGSTKAGVVASVPPACARASSAAIRSRHGDARRAERPRRAVRGRDLVPHAAGRDRARPPARPAPPAGRARRHAGRDRRRRARPPAGASRATCRTCSRTCSSCRPARRASTATTRSRRSAARSAT